MNSEVLPRMLVAVSDLFFTVKILDAAKRALLQPEIIKDAQLLLARAAEQPRLIVFDLNFDGIKPVNTIRALKEAETTRGISLIGFVSHVQGDLKKEAQDAGCDIVLARSAFSQNLPQILKRYASAI